ncbi:MAG TPA: acyl-CoA dehydrogenase family protein, partial [Acidimicrobiales bacterium]|nr:acyl-CoA dehydrogenase family protein [Acidimicrobiales bacterium]
MAHTAEEICRAVADVADDWRSQRSDRQGRRHHDPADFATLRSCGFPLLAVPEAQGGTWVDPVTSVRPIAGALRALAAGDPSVALVSAMHPAVLTYWLCPPDEDEAWAAQRVAVFESAAGGHQWATVTSEPGSGGDIAKTKATARQDGDVWRVSGDKHFGSGTGVADRMITTAVPEGEDLPTVFVLDTTTEEGRTVIAEWDGMGMRATQSHAVRLDGAPAFRLATARPIEQISGPAMPPIEAFFVAVVLGVLDEAVATARAQVRDRAESLRAYERVEWARAEQDHWLAVQAHEGALRALETGDLAVATHAAIRAKQSIAELAEQTLLRLGRVLGGGTFSQRSPFSHWLEDVRALGFLRPPWG